MSDYEDSLAALRKSLEPVPGYSWSTDYSLAARLVEGGRLLGLVLYDVGSDGHKMFDACGIRKHGTHGFSVGVRGLSYFDAWDEKQFKELCAKYEVRFLVPEAK